MHLCAFDLVELDGRDLRLKPLTERRRLLAKLVHRPRAGLLLNAQFQDDGPLLFARLRGLRVEAQDLALSLRPILRLGQEQESGSAGREAGSGRGLVKGALAMSVAPPGGEDRIMIYGPKADGTYVVEFRTAAGEALAISVPGSEAAVLKHFQARMPYGLVVPDIDEGLGHA